MKHLFFCYRNYVSRAIVILSTIAKEITYNEDTNKLTVKLNPIFEHLRQIKSQSKQSFSADLETLSGTPEKRSASAKEALKNDDANLNNVIMIGTRQSRINTEIEPDLEGFKKQNVDEVTILEPKDKGIVTHGNTLGNKYLRLISIMKQSTQEYYNMRTLLGLKSI